MERAWYMWIMIVNNPSPSTLHLAVWRRGGMNRYLKSTKPFPNNPQAFYEAQLALIQLIKEEHGPDELIAVTTATQLTVNATEQPTQTISQLESQLESQLISLLAASAAA